MVRLRIMPRAALLILLLAIPAVGQELSLPTGAAGRVGAGRLRHRDEVAALAYSDDGKLLAVAAGDLMCVYDSATGQLRRKLNYLASPKDLSGGDVENVFDKHGKPQTILRFSADGRRLFIGGAGYIRIGDLATGKVSWNVTLGN